MRQFRFTRRAAALLLTFCLIGGMASGCASQSPAIDPNTPSAAPEGTSSSQDLASDMLGALAGGVLASKKAATPEEALQQFFAALKAQDAEAALACCNIEDYCDRYSFADRIDWAQFASTFDGAPTEYPFYRDFMVCERRGTFARIIRTLTYSLILTDEKWSDYIINGNTPQVDGAWAEEFIVHADPAQLQDLEILRIDESRPDMQKDERMQESFRRNFHAENNVAMSALLRVNGTLFCKSFVLSEIDGGWQISNLASPLVTDEPSTGAALIVESEAAYLELIA